MRSWPGATRRLDANREALALDIDPANGVIIVGGNAGRVGLTPARRCREVSKVTSPEEKRLAFI